MLENFLKALIVGLGASIPLGPVGILCIQKTLSKGRNSGFSVGLGSSIADTFYASLALLSLAFIQSWLYENKLWVMIVGGIIIALFGIRIALKNPVKQIRQPKQGTKKHVQDLLQGLLFTITNPGSLVLLLALFAFVRIDINQHENHTVSVLLAGVFTGTLTWWSILSTSINAFRKKFRLRQLLYINRISGTVIAVLGLISTMEGIYRMFFVNVI